MAVVAEYNFNGAIVRVNDASYANLTPEQLQFNINRMLEVAKALATNHEIDRIRKEMELENQPIH